MVKSRTILFVGDPLRGSGAVSDERVLLAKGLADARIMLAEERIGLIVSDLDPFDGSGLELLSYCTDGPSPAEQLRVLLLARHSTTLERLVAAKRPWVMERPPTLKQALRFALDVKGAVPNLLDYCQLALAGVHAVAFEVFGEKGFAGVVEIRSNTCWAAADKMGEGVSALFRLAQAQRRIVCRDLPEAVVVKSIQWKLDEVLFGHDEDEAPKSCGVSGPRSFRSGAAAPPMRNPRTLQGLPAVRSDGQPSGGVVVQLPGQPSAPAARSEEKRGEDFDTLWEGAVESMLRKEYDRARTLLLAAQKLRPDHASVSANLARLDLLGRR